jgi:hypothetical protein
MQFKTLTGLTRKISKAHKYRIDWDAPSRSKIQFKVKKILQKIWEPHVVFEEFPVAGTKMSLDFYNANKNIAIEVQGKQHTKYVPFFHGQNKINFISQVKRDFEKREFCKLNEIKLIEIHENEAFDLNSIKSVLNS